MRMSGISGGVTRQRHSQVRGVGSVGAGPA
jgi:hypothetical protein